MLTPMCLSADEFESLVGFCIDNGHEQYELHGVLEQALSDIRSGLDYEDRFSNTETFKGLQNEITMGR